MMESTLTLMMLMSMMVASMLVQSPPALCITLCIFTISSCMVISFIINKSLLPYIILLTIIGGLMILFLYFTSINKTDSPKKTPKFTLMSISTLIFLSLKMDMDKFSKSSSTLSSQTNTDAEETMLIFSSTHLPMTILTISVLLILLFSIIMICSKMNKPLRRKLKIWK